MIRNRDTLADSPAHRTALHCVEAGIRAAAPDRVIRDRLTRDGDRLVIARDGPAADSETYDLSEYDDIVLVGGGKAAAGVAATVEALLGDRLTDGVVVTNTPEPTERVAVVEANHPVPDRAGVEGAERVREAVADADERTLVLAVVTGGASALLPAPADGLSLDDLRAVTDALLESGATIDEINAVRKHCSALKGGLLAREAAPATVVGLLFSDVVGDDPAVIGSGPTAPDPSTYADALAVLDDYDIDAPAAVRERLGRGADGDLEETPTADDTCFDRVRNFVLANAWTALDAARDAAADAGFRTVVLSSRIEGEAREAARTQAAVAAEIAATGNPVEPPAVVLSGGETTVTIRGEGRGGPNTEFALSAARDLPATAVLASVDTDGEDGASGVAGALVDSDTVDDHRAATAALRDNDAAGYLDSRNALIETGRTGTNVNDLRVLVVTKS